MDGRRFDEISRALATGASRRRVLKGLTGGVVGALGAALGARQAAAAPTKCRNRGSRCGQHANCCTLNCCGHVCCGADEPCRGGTCVACAAGGAGCVEGGATPCCAGFCARDGRDEPVCLACLPGGAFTACNATDRPCCAGLFCTGVGLCASCLGSNDTVPCNATDRPCCRGMTCTGTGPEATCCGEAGAFCNPFRENACCAGLECSATTGSCVAVPAPAPS